MFISLLTLLQDTTDFSASSEGRSYNPPEGPLYYVILIVSSLIVLAVIFYTVKWFLWPGEKSDDHIKRKILEPEPQENNHNE
ncbi:MAG TPA: hypothetical protein VK112_09035 [Fodinibius sp.]|nr:hypothetical protein [Fodinibius sp.]